MEKWGGPTLPRSNEPRGSGRAPFLAKQPSKKMTSKRHVFPRVADAFARGNFSKKNSPWNRLLAAKSIVVEPRLAADLPQAIEDYKNLLRQPKSPGCILMGVCRGKISEGMGESTFSLFSFPSCAVQTATNF